MSKPHSLPLQFYWFIPSYGDSRYLGSKQFRRAPDLGYLRSVAQTVDSLGFDGALLPTGGCDDSWIIAAAIAQSTSRMRLLAAVRPGTVVPVVAARMAATMDRISGGRLSINIVPGDNEALREDGLTIDSSEKYALAHEWTSALRRLLRGETVTMQGKYVQLRDACLDILPGRADDIGLFFGGSSDEALDVAAQHCDVYLSWGEPPALLAEKIRQVQERAARCGRRLRVGLRVHCLVRETDEEAQADAQKLISHISDDDIVQAQAQMRLSDSTGRMRMRELHGGDRSKVWIAPGLWAGIGLVRGGAGTALVGSPQTVCRLLREYAQVGIDTFVLSGYPHMEEAYRFAELVFPQMRGNPAAAGHGAVPTGAVPTGAVPAGAVQF